MSQQLAEAWFEVFREKDLAQLEALLADDFSHASPFGMISSKADYLDLVRSNSEAFFSPTLDIVDMISEGDKVAVRYRVNGNPACDCIYSANGQITKIIAYYHYGEKPSM